MIINGFGGSPGGSLAGFNQGRLVRTSTGTFVGGPFHGYIASNSRLNGIEYFNDSNGVLIGSYTCPAGTTSTLNSTIGTSGTNLRRYNIYSTLTLQIPSYLYGIPGNLFGYYTDTSGDFTSKDLWTLSSSRYTTNKTWVVVRIRNRYKFPMLPSNSNVGDGTSTLVCDSNNGNNWLLSAYTYSSGSYVCGFTNGLTSTSATSTGQNFDDVCDESHPYVVDFYNFGYDSNHTDPGVLTFTNIYSWTVQFKFYPATLY